MSGQQTFNMGQIIYILSNKSQAVVPAVVDEQVVRKIRKPDGVHEVVSYKLCIGPKDRQQIVDLSRVDGEVFDSLESIKTVLVERLTGFVDQLVKTTQNNVLNWYGIMPGSEVVNGGIVDSSGAENKFDPAQLVHAVNNNLPLQTAQVNNQPHPLQIQGAPLNPREQIRENLRAIVTGQDEFNNGMVRDNSETQTLILEDGTRVKVRL